MIRVTVFNAHPTRRLRKRAIAQYVRSVLRGECRDSARISVVLVGNRESRRLNRRYLRHNHATDVISFCLDQKNLEGEIYVNLDRASEQARTYRISTQAEIARLVVHGTLHLAGYTDADRKEANRMKKKENSYVAYWYPLDAGR